MAADVFQPKCDEGFFATSAAMNLTTCSSLSMMTKGMMKTDTDEIRLNSLRLLAKMIASAYLKQAYQAPGADLVVAERNTGYVAKRRPKYSDVAQAVQDQTGGK